MRTSYGGSGKGKKSAKKDVFYVNSTLHFSLWERVKLLFGHAVCVGYAIQDDAVKSTTCFVQRVSLRPPR